MIEVGLEQLAKIKLLINVNLFNYTSIIFLYINKDYRGEL
jgi:hypothetical protein